MIKHPRRIIRALDLFAGMGGSSWGARMAGVRIVGAVDIWDLAERTYLDNLDGVKFYRRKCENLSVEKVRREIGPIQMLLASPECTSHTCAKGSAERSESSRKTALQVVRFAQKMKPRWIVVENVIQMRDWHRYHEWIQKLETLGYKIKQQILNSADFGVPQSRRRLFVICDMETVPPEVIPTRKNNSAAVSDVIDSNGRYPFSALEKQGRAKSTLERAGRAITALGGKGPFLLVYYGTDGAGGWQRVDAPLRTITTLDRFAYVRLGEDGQHEMRMLQVPELKKAMGFPKSYRLDHGTRREKIRLLGNAVCPPVMKAIIEAMTRANTRKVCKERVGD